MQTVAYEARNLASTSYPYYSYNIEYLEQAVCTGRLIPLIQELSSQLVRSRLQMD